MISFLRELRQKIWHYKVIIIIIFFSAREYDDGMRKINNLTTIEDLLHTLTNHSLLKTCDVKVEDDFVNHSIWTSYLFATIIITTIGK